MPRYLIAFVFACTWCCSPPTGDPSAGQVIFAEKCAVCHGEDGLGVEGSTPTATAPNLRERVLDISDSAIERAISDGTGEMSPVEMTPEELEDVIAFLRQAWD